MEVQVLEKIRTKINDLDTTCGELLEISSDIPGIRCNLNQLQALIDLLKIECPEWKDTTDEE